MKIEWVDDQLGCLIYTIHLNYQINWMKLWNTIIQFLSTLSMQVK